MFKDSLIGLKMSDSNIETVEQTQSTIEDNSIVHNAVVEAVMYRM